MCPYFGHEAPLDNQFTLGNALIYLGWLGVMFVVVTIERFDLREVMLRLLDRQLFARRLFLVVLRPWLTLALVTTFASIVWANLILLGDHTFNFTLRVCRGFILHTLHHLHQPLAHFWNINPLVYYLPHPRLDSMQEDQLLSILILQEYHS